MATVLRPARHAVLFLRSHRWSFLETSSFYFHLNYQVLDERFGGQSRIDEEINDVHDLIQGKRQNATAEIGIFVELEIHFSANVVIRYLGEALLPKDEALGLLQLFFD